MAGSLNRADAWFTPGRFAGLLGLLIFLAYPGVVLGWQTFVFRDFGLFNYPVAFYFRESFWRNGGTWSSIPSMDSRIANEIEHGQFPRAEIRRTHVFYEAKYAESANRCAKEHSFWVRLEDLLERRHSCRLWR